MPNDKKIYDLEERTGRFGEDIIEFAKQISKTVITIPLIGQLTSKNHDALKINLAFDIKYFIGNWKLGIRNSIYYNHLSIRVLKVEP